MGQHAQRGLNGNGVVNGISGDGVRSRLMVEWRGYVSGGFNEKGKRLQVWESEK